MSSESFSNCLHNLDQPGFILEDLKSNKRKRFKDMIHASGLRNSGSVFQTNSCDLEIHAVGVGLTFGI